MNTLNELSFQKCAHGANIQKPLYDLNGSNFFIYFFISKWIIQGLIQREQKTMRNY